jgi:serine/threonine protein kinase
MLAPGDTLLQRYRIEALVGRGASSLIYRAHDTALERTVALKAFEDISGDPTLARIQREAKIYSQLAHPRIVKMHDVLLRGRSIYFVLEFVEGRSLAHILQTRVPSLKEIFGWTEDLLETVTYIHSVGVIHRDIKPSNVLIHEASGTLNLSDFGTSKAINEVSSLTVIGGMVGTIIYAAPEQREAREVTPAVDVYSSGIVLYQMLTGRLPFDRPFQTASPEIVDNVRSIQPSIPPGIVDLLRQMLSSEPAHRPTSTVANATLKRLLATIDLDRLAHSGVVRRSIERSSSAGTIPPEDPLSMVTMFTNAAAAKPTGFFADQAVRLSAYNKSVEFFRSHLDSDYKNLLDQAKLAFVLWLGCVGIAFAILIAGVVLVFRGETTSGVITLAADSVVLFIQNIFKQREDYYREEAKEKHAHLQMGNAWTLAVQSVDGIADPSLREQKLAALSDELVKAFRSDSALATAPRLGERLGRQMSRKPPGKS